jgi:hypothetical protein
MVCSFMDRYHPRSIESFMTIEHHRSKYLILQKRTAEKASHFASSFRKNLLIVLVSILPQSKAKTKIVQASSLLIIWSRYPFQLLLLLLFSFFLSFGPRYRVWTKHLEKLVVIDESGDCFSVAFAFAAAQDLCCWAAPCSSAS